MEVKLIHIHDNTIKNMEPLIKKVAHISYKKDGDLSESAASRFIQKHVLNAGHHSLLRHAWYTAKIETELLLKQWELQTIPNHIRNFIFLHHDFDKTYVSGTLDMWRNLINHEDSHWSSTGLFTPKDLVTIAPTVFKKGDYCLDEIHGEDIPKETYAYTFIVKGCSRLFTHQQVRHSYGWAYNQESTRYVDYSEGFNIVVPNKLIDGLDGDIERIKQDVVEPYNQLLKRGYKREDARFFLPNGITSVIAITVRHDALMGSYKRQRAEGKTGKPSGEIQAVAREMIRLVNAVHGDLE